LRNIEKAEAMALFGARDGPWRIASHGETTSKILIHSVGGNNGYRYEEFSPPPGKSFSAL
jgi:hypothetical protein